MAAIAFTDAQLEQIRMTAAQIPRRLRDAYLQRVVQLLNRSGLRGWGCAPCRACHSG
jgi:hypothetical protein